MADSVVAGWLAELNLHDLIPTFRDEGVDSVALAGLEDGQLKELGVKRMGDRTKLRAKGMGIALPKPAAASSSATPAAPGGEGSMVHVPEHLRVLNRLSGSPAVNAAEFGQFEVDYGGRV
ncbi:hypothetical protein T484DRAFT_1844919 [Baffinella frigidus]|nr:hypothetical protein T484DRAFT_1844919 [Cryptophyta sp. CCMP2293]